MIRNRAGALIIRDKKLLLVTDKDEIFYWSPGGMVEGGEMFEDALSRELKEELNIVPQKIIFYMQFNASEQSIPGFTAPPSFNKYYIVETEDVVKVGAEIAKFIWATKEKLEKIVLLPEVRKNVVNKLIKDGLI